MLIKDFINLCKTDFEEYKKVLHKLMLQLHEPKHVFALEKIILDQTKIDNLNKEELQSSHSLLPGVPFALKDNLATAGIKTTSSSNILSNFDPGYDATSYQKLKSAKGILAAKCVLDELGMGGNGMYSNHKCIRNPYHKDHIIGGSSSGSCWLVANGLVPFSLATDTGDSIRRPAAFSSLYGMKPSWGRVSRHGLFSFAPSFDAVGVLARSVWDTAYVLSIISGTDEFDQTTSDCPVSPYYLNLQNPLANKKVAIIKGVLHDIKNKYILHAFKDLIAYLKSQDYVVEEVEFDLKYLQALLVIYQILTFSEAVSSNNNLTGILFGSQVKKADWISSVKATRNNGFLLEVKKRFLIGAYSLKEENIFYLYTKAQKIRYLINQHVLAILNEYCGILTPSYDGVAPLISDATDTIKNIEQTHYIDYLTLFANFGGLPSIAFPYGFHNNLPYGFTFTGRLFDEQSCFNFAELVSKKTKIEDVVANA